MASLLVAARECMHVAMKAYGRRTLASSARGSLTPVRVQSRRWISATPEPRPEPKPEFASRESTAQDARSKMQDMHTEARSEKEGTRFRREFVDSYRRNIYITYHDMEMALRRRGYSLYRLLLGTVIAVAATTAIFWRRIKHWGAQEGASVATKTLEDEMLQRKAEDLAKQLTNALLTDERTTRAVQTLLKQLLSDPTARKDAAEFVKQVLTALMNNEETRDAVAQFLADLLQFDSVRDGAKDLAVWVVSHPYVIEKVKLSLIGILDDVDARSGGKDFAMDATLRTLQDQDTKRWLQTLVEDVFVDPQFQEKAGEALWNATKSGILGVRTSKKQIDAEIKEIERLQKDEKDGQNDENDGQNVNR